MTLFPFADGNFFNNLFLLIIYNTIPIPLLNNRLCTFNQKLIFRNFTIHKCCNVNFVNSSNQRNKTFSEYKYNRESEEVQVLRFNKLNLTIRYAFTMEINC